jgi:hypothetical protein
MTRQRDERPLGLHAVGRPYSPNFDPNYKLRHKVSIAHLRQPYGHEMRFVGDTPETRERRGRAPKPKPAPLLEPISDDAQKLAAARKLLRDIKGMLHGLIRAMSHTVERAEGIRAKIQTGERVEL